MRRILLAAGIACGALLLGTVVAEPAAAQTGYYPYVLPGPRTALRFGLPRSSSDPIGHCIFMATPFGEITMVEPFQHKYDEPLHPVVAKR